MRAAAHHVDEPYGDTMKRTATRGLRAACIAVALACATPAAATSFSTNYSDLWWNPDESGWGVNITQQADVLFATMFVYGAQGQPVWYSATLRYNGENITGNQTWSGDLYETHGPALFTLPFDPALVTLKKVGFATFASKGNDKAIFQYSSPDISMIATKEIQRQTLVNNNLAGSYVGGTSDVTANCTNPARNGLNTNDFGSLTITHAGNAVTIVAPTCTFTGTYLQTGQTGSIGGTYACTNNASGNITFFDLRVEQSGILGKYTGHDSSCAFNGNIGGLRRP
jgi:hypothetical protein